jgi:hypothetical protein
MKHLFALACGLSLISAGNAMAGTGGARAHARRAAALVRHGTSRLEGHTASAMTDDG